MSAESPREDAGSGMPRTYAQFAVFMLALVLALAFVFGHDAGGNARFTPDKWLNKDGSFYYLTLRTLVDRHTLAQDQTQPRSWYEQDLRWNRTLNADWSDVAVGREGHWYPKHAILMPLATVPETLTEPRIWRSELATEAATALPVAVLFAVLVSVTTEPPVTVATRGSCRRRGWSGRLA